MEDLVNFVDVTYNHGGEIIADMGDNFRGTLRSWQDALLKEEASFGRFIDGVVEEAGEFFEDAGEWIEGAVEDTGEFFEDIPEMIDPIVSAIDTAFFAQKGNPAELAQLNSEIETEDVGKWFTNAF